MSFKRLLTLILVVVLSVSILVACSGDSTTATEKSEEVVELLVSAAASLTDVMQELGDVYEDRNKNVNLTFTFAGSGTLQTQIEEGAPVDVFMSAAEKQMDTLEKKELILNDTRKTLLINKVVLITPSNSRLSISAFEDILNPEMDKIAIGDPSNVPVGQYSEEIFNNLNMMDTLQSKLIFGNDVRAVLTWVETNEVDSGIVYATDAYTSDEVNIVAEAPDGSHKQVTYPVAVVKSSKKLEESQNFVDFLSTDKAKEVFEKYGFTMK